MCALWILLLISTLPLHISSNHTMRTAVCFLTVRPANETLKFADRLAPALQQDNIDVFIMVDDNSFRVPSAEKTIVKLIQIPNK